MGVVFLAEDTEISRRVAIKVLSPDLSADANLVARFDREAKTAAGLEHPAIVRIYEQGSKHGLHYFVMQYVTGQTLAEILRDEPRASVDFVTRVLREAAAALMSAHRHDVVHRDVKPENIMIDTKGRVLLTDFGISRVSRAADSATTMARLTNTGGVVGTPHYMAPEHALGQKMDGRADQYALAVVAFQMLAGQLPFDDETAAAVIHLHINKAAPRLSSLRPDVPPHLAAAIARAMSKSPEHRYATIGEFATAAAGGAARELLRHRASWAATVVLLLASAAVGGWRMRVDTRVVTTQAIKPTVTPQGVKPEVVKPPVVKPPVVKPPVVKRPVVKSQASQPAIPPNSFKLSVTSTPSATLWVDGRRVGVTPISGYTLSNRGRRFLRLEREGYRTQRDTIGRPHAATVRRNYVLQRKPK